MFKWLADLFRKDTIPSPPSRADIELLRQKREEARVIVEAERRTPVPKPANRGSVSSVAHRVPAPVRNPAPHASAPRSPSTVTRRDRDDERYVDSGPSVLDYAIMSAVINSDTSSSSSSSSSYESCSSSSYDSGSSSSSYDSGSSSSDSGGSCGGGD